MVGLLRIGSAIKNNGKFFAVLFSSLACVIAALYVELILQIDVVYTHLFYIPIILAGIWYQKKALYVALMLGTAHILMVYFSPIPLSVNEAGRAIIFLVVAYVIGIVSEKEAKEGAALRKSEEKYRSLVESTEDSVYLVDRDCNYLYINEKHLTRLGLSSDDVLHKSYAEFHSEGETKEFAEKVAEVLKTGRSLQYEPSIRKDQRWFLRTLSPVKDSKGGITALTVVSKDITKQKQAAQEVSERKLYLESVLACAPDAIVTLDAQHSIQEWNRGAERLFGYSSDEAIGRNLDDLVLPKDTNTIEESNSLTKRVLAHKHLSPIETVLYRKDGTSIAVIAAGSPIKLEDELIGVVVVCTDITERKQVEDKLAKIVDGSSIPTFVINSDHKITHWNTAIELLTTLERGRVIGTSIHWKSFYPEERPFMADLIVDGAPESEFKARYSTKFKKSTLIEGAYEAEGFFPHLGAQEKWLFFTAAPLRDSAGHVIGAIETFQDITKSKQIEGERERLVKELEAKNKELERFTYTVSHDLRSPLLAIEGFAGLLSDDLEKGKAEKVKDDLERIVSAAQKMDSLLNDTLQLSRIGRVASPPEDVPFGDIVKDALELTAEQIKSSGVEISVALAEDLPTVHVDRMRIVEVLENLIGNSIKYRGEEQHLKIDIGYRVENEETVFFVKDNGIGIDPSQHEKVFELFYKLDPDSTGTGAGLAIVKRIIEVHGGRIWIESAKGNGCTVCFTLVVKKENTPY